MMKASILIPVFNSAAMLKNLLDTLVRNTAYHLVEEVIIGDDGSDKVTKAVIEEFVKNEFFPIRNISREKNIGYLRNINNLFSLAKGEIVISLNSDTMLPPNWLARMLRPFELNEKIAVASPFSNNAANLTIFPREGQSWLDVDEGLSSLSPNYPYAHLVVGYALAIRRQCITSQYLFDEYFHPGYGEENDLQFRLESEGYQAVIVDNLYIYHAPGSSSFSQMSDITQIRINNEEKFLKRWKKKYYESRQRYIDENIYQSLRNTTHIFSYVNPEQYIDILFLLPCYSKYYSENSFIIRLCDWLRREGVQTAIYAYGDIDSMPFKILGLNSPWTSLGNLKLNVKSVGSVVSFLEFPEIIEEIKQYYASSYIYWFNNIYNALFAVMELKESLALDLKKSQFISSSKSIQSILNSANISADFIPLIPDIYSFYPNDKIYRNEKAIAVFLASNNAEELSLIWYCLYLAKEAGFLIYIYHDKDGYYKVPFNFSVTKIENHPQTLRNIFSSVGYFINGSFFVHSNTLTLSAAFCGAIPIIFSPDPACAFFKNNQTAFFSASIGMDKLFFNNLTKKTKAEITVVRQACIQLSSSISSSFSFPAISLILKKSKNEVFLPSQVSKKKWRKISANPVINEIVSGNKSFISVKYRLFEFAKKLIHRIFNFGNRNLEARLEHISFEIEKQREILFKLADKS